LGGFAVLFAAVYLPHRYVEAILALASFFVGWKIGNRQSAPEDKSFIFAVTSAIFVIGWGLLLLAAGVTR